MTDLVSPELRKVERLVDSAYKANLLMKKPFAEAAWHFLALYEDYFVVPLVVRDPTRMPRSPYEFSNMVDSLTTDTKWPLYWLWKRDNEGGHIPRSFVENMYGASKQLLDLAKNYTAFESAYTYASKGVTTLKLKDKTITSDYTQRRDRRYAAYDALVSVPDEGKINVNRKVSERLQRTITNRLRLNGGRFTYKLNDRLVRLALQFANVSLGRGPSLPGDWKFSRYTVGDFQRCARFLRALCFIHVFARVKAAPFTPACGYKDSLIIAGKNELHKQLRKHTRLSASVVSALVEDLTYGSHGIRFPDPPLQPLMPLLSNRYVIAPHLILNSSMERNFAVLMNRIPEERQIYSGLSSAREQISRLRIINALSRLRIRHWHGTVQGWGRSGEIDLALMDRTSKSCLILELKSFVGTRRT